MSVAKRTSDNLRTVEEEFVGTAEVAVMLGLTRQRVQQLTRDADFPAPLQKISAGWIWRRSDVEQWMRDREPDVDDDEA